MCRARYEASRCPLRYGRPHRTGTHFRLASFSCVATFTRVTPHTPRVHGFTAMPRVDSCAPYDRSKVPHGSLSPVGCSALHAVSRTLEACLFAAKGDRPLWGCIPSPLATLALIGLHRAAPSMPRFPSIPCKLARSESLSVVPSVFEGIGVHDPTLGALG